MADKVSAARIPSTPEPFFGDWCAHTAHQSPKNGVGSRWARPERGCWGWHHLGVTQYGTPPPSGSGERWNVNLPAVVGVVFVFLVGVIVWVIASGSGDDDGDASGEVVTSETATPTTTDAADTTALTTTPPPMPTTTVAPPESTDATTTTSTTAESTTTSTVPVTTAPGAGDGAVPGDLAIPGRPMQQPACDGSFITIVASAVGDQATAAGIEAVLDTYPSSEYLRTDQTCSSLRPDVDGEPIYVVYFGPFAFEADACTARAQGPEGAYAKQLSNDIGPDQVVDCS